jgi:triosephosphate isomerase
MNKKKILVVANWKMNPETAEEAKEIFNGTQKIANDLKNVKVVICPPYIYLQNLEKLVEAVKLGAQDVFCEQAGPFTGEISPKMLKREGEEYVIIGHSERRELGETDEVVSKKALASLKTGLKVILCVGENSRDSHGDYLNLLRSQITNSLSKISRRYLKKLTIAYEPVWAIGKSEDEALKPRDLHETSIFIKKVLSEIYGQKTGMEVPILYGGSVNHNNAKDLLILGEVQGLLVGHESLNVKKFENLLRSVNN